jgi:hypothetical protein
MHSLVADKSNVLLLSCHLFLSSLYTLFTHIQQLRAASFAKQKCVHAQSTDYVTFCIESRYNKHLSIRY